MLGGVAAVAVVEGAEAAASAGARGRRAVEQSLFATLERGLALQEADELAEAAEEVLAAGARQGARRRTLDASVLASMLRGASGMPAGGAAGEAEEGLEATLGHAQRAGRRLYAAGPEGQWLGLGRELDVLGLSIDAEAKLAPPMRLALHTARVLRAAGLADAVGGALGERRELRRWLHDNDLSVVSSTVCLSPRTV